MKVPFINWNRRTVKTVVLAMLALLVTGLAYAAGGGGGHEAAVRGWEATDTYRVLNFTVLAVAVFMAARKPVAEALSARIKGIKDELEALEAEKSEAEKTLAGYNAKLASLESEGEKIVEQYIAQGEAAKKKILEEAASAAGKLEEQASRNIAHEFNNAKMKLQEEVVSQALVKAEALVKKSITAKDQDKLVDEYLNKVVA